MFSQTAASQFRPALRADIAAPAARPAAAASPLDQALGELASRSVRMSYRRGEEVFGEGEPADFVYRVISGAVRSYRLLSDGRRQICEFHLPGGFFGLEPGLEHRTTAEAVGEGVVLLVIRRTVLAEVAGRDNRVAGAMWRMSAEGLQRSQDHILMLGRKGASERVAGFLIDFAGRIGAQGDFELPMSRQDIADYLGLTIETVSRTFSQLEGEGIIKAHNSRRIRLTDRQALEDICE